MAEAESIVGRSIPCTEARAAESGLHHRAGLQDSGGAAVFNQFHIYRHGGRIYAQGKAVAADVLSLQNVRRGADILKAAARTACDNALVHQEFAVFDLVLQMEFHCPAQTHLGPLFRLLQNIRQVGVEFLDGIGVAGMEGHGDHGTHLGQIHGDHTVIVSHFPRCQFHIVLFPAVNLVEFPDLAVRLPDRGQAGGLGGHHIHADTEIRTQGGHAGTHKLHHLIFHISVGKHGPDNGQRHILGAYAPDRFPGQIHAHHAGHIDVIGLV